METRAGFDAIHSARTSVLEMLIISGRPGHPLEVRVNCEM